MGFSVLKRILRRFLINSASNQQPEEINFHGIQFTVGRFFKKYSLYKYRLYFTCRLQTYLQEITKDWFITIVHVCFCSVMFSSKAKVKAAEQLTLEEQTKVNIGC
jgi:hypothetical protein